MTIKTTLFWRKLGIIEEKFSNFKKEEILKEIKKRILKEVVGKYK